MAGIPVTVNGKRWQLVFEPLKKEYGRCDSPSTPGKKITISPEVKRDDQLYLETILHEILHAAVWNLDEEFVTEYAKVAARTAIRLGFNCSGEPHGKKPS
jgi:hypothetical protein